MKTLAFCIMCLPAEAAHRRQRYFKTQLYFESNYFDLEIKTIHRADSVVGHEKHGMALKKRCASVVK